MTGELEARLGYSFSDPALLSNALTHSSYANENRAAGVLCNERLEFLGDSVLNMLTAKYLFLRLDGCPEGELTRLRAAMVCESALYGIAQKLELGSFLLLGKGEDASGGRERASVLADATEAVIAAIFLDGGLSAAERFLLPYLDCMAPPLIKQHAARDYKTALQEIVQKSKQEVLHYELTGEDGPPHDRRFSVTVFLNSNPVAHGLGRSKKEAEQSAAKAALELMGEEV